MTSKELVDALEDLHMDPKAYSARGMYGRQCVAVDVEYLGDAFELGFGLGGFDKGSPGNPSSDTMGKGFVLYWPNMDWPEADAPLTCPQCGACVESIATMHNGEEYLCTECGNRWPT